MDRCLVIGGNSGIGEAVVGILSEGEASVYAPDTLEVDVTVQRQIWQYVQKHGPFEQIVYSAGVNQLQWIKDYPEDGQSNLWDSFNVNVAGFVSLVSIHRRTWPSQEVSAVAISSDAATNPMRGSLAYCVSKAALEMAVRCIARELAPLWRVNCVAPGMVEGTDMTRYIDETIPGFRGWSREHAREYERSSVPSGRRATIEEVAETVRWVLTGPEQMTGSIITINGGKS